MDQSSLTVNNYRSFYKPYNKNKNDPNLIRLANKIAKKIFDEGYEISAENIQLMADEEGYKLDARFVNQAMSTYDDLVRGLYSRGGTRRRRKRGKKTRKTRSSRRRTRR
jgi:hypothetical protein